ncbi:MAG: c-type cytochrome [Chloroflexi bacterium]|nr:c-type cytochrome [Chloroflexota bacterium]
MVIGAAGAIVALALLLFLIWMALYATAPRPAEPEGPPTGSVSSERKVLTAIVLVVLTGVSLTVYGFFEPARQAAAAERQQKLVIERGIANYASLCYACHGFSGDGAVVPDSNPPVVTPQLNRAQFQPTDPDEIKSISDSLYKTIQRGRPNTPMPAWGQTDGGSLNEEQIRELVTMIMNGNKPVEGDKTTWDVAGELVKKHVADGSPAPKKPVAQVDTSLSSDAQAGQKIWQEKGACIGCHVIQGIAGGGKTGPELSNIGKVAATRKPGMSAEDYIHESIVDPHAFVVPGYPPVMPSYRGTLSEDEIKQLVAYYMTRKQ